MPWHLTIHLKNWQLEGPMDVQKFGIPVTPAGFKKELSFLNALTLSFKANKTERGRQIKYFPFLLKQEMPDYFIINDFPKNTV